MAATATVTERHLDVDPASCSLAYGPNSDRLCWWCGQDVPAGRYEWCSQACAAAFDDAHSWDRARRAALRRAAHRCAVTRCPERHAVEVHHVEPVGARGYGPGCQHHPENLRVLCAPHHDETHRVVLAKPGRQMALFLAA